MLRWRTSGMEMLRIWYPLIVRILVLVRSLFLPPGSGRGPSIVTVWISPELSTVMWSKAVTRRIRLTLDGRVLFLLLRHGLLLSPRRAVPLNGSLLLGFDQPPVHLASACRVERVRAALAAVLQVTHVRFPLDRVPASTFEIYKHTIMKQKHLSLRKLEQDMDDVTVTKPCPNNNNCLFNYSFYNGCIRA